MKPQHVLAFLCVFALLAFALLFAAPVRAAPTSNFVVNNSGDQDDANPGDNHCEYIPTNGQCTLRAAIHEANAHAGADSISFSITGTIVIGSRLPPITDTLTIVGPGEANLTISGNNAVGVMQVNSGTTASLSGVTIANGNATFGGGIQISGTLSISGTTFRNDHSSGLGGAVYNAGGAVTITSTTFYSNSSASDAGAIANVNFGVITITTSTIYSNTAVSGTGVWNDTSGSLNMSNSKVYSNTNSGSGTINNASGWVDISNSSFYSNTGNINSGVIYNSTPATTTISSSVFYTNTGAAGGVFVNAGTLIITNSTFYDNRGTANSGVGYNGSGAITLTNSTLYGNHASTAGGIWKNGGSVSLRNTIIAYNSPGTNCLGVPTSLGYNIESANDCSLLGTGDLVNTNPLLLALANNGGATKTNALFVGSPAMNRIPNGTNLCGTVITTDQRGVARPQGTKCDVGAYEYDGPLYTLFLPLIMK